MISIRQQSYGLNVALFNEFTVEDFKLLEQSVADVLQEHEQPDLLLDLSLMRDFTIDMAWEQVRFTRQHIGEFGLIAIVVNDWWIELGARLSNLLSMQHAKYFKTAEEAQAWLMSEPEKQIEDL
ncbi:MAG: STAS/SEC14 domain-containing protein [Vitreoscilla sp.]|jgi:hypothetical protein|nr:STAS/SEC14 domain-containing protein [Vitreoscilla sp.]MBP9540434.1 STAS/SEC14 domain-containing protein [Vitreoscilla sp.]